MSTARGPGTSAALRSTAHRIRENRLTSAQKGVCKPPGPEATRVLLVVISASRSAIDPVDETVSPGHAPVHTK